MSHNINIVNGVVSMMYVGETPWHTLGKRLENPATASEAIEVANLGFRVEKFPLRTAWNDLLVPDHYATVRTDTMDILGVVGSRYMPIQNKDAFTVFDELVGEGQAIYHTAGALGRGERVWILAKLPDYIKVIGDDIVEKYLLFTNTHDGSSTVSVKLTPIRVVCQNTLSAALQGTEQQVHVRHTAQAEEKLKQAHKILGLSNKLFDQLGQYYIGMSKKEINGAILNQYIKSVFPQTKFNYSSAYMKRIQEKIVELFESGVGAELAKGTLWMAYNAVTEYVDHVRLQSKSSSIRLKSIWYGAGEATKTKALTSAIAFLN